MTRLLFGAAVAGLVLAGGAQASVITFYGDDDGFGVGQTAGTLTNPNTSNAGPGEAPFTDVRLIGTGFSAPGFQPTGGFNFVLDGTIASITLTLRTGAFDSGPNPVDGPNSILLDGMAIDASFLAGFSSLNTNLIETRSIVLPGSFFALFTDGAVSLSGTRITEAGGSESFQIDFLRLDIVTRQVVPEPGSLALIAAGLLGLAAARRRRK